MNTRGHPLRFLGLVVGGWVCLRAGMVLTPAMLGGSDDVLHDGQDASVRSVRDDGSGAEPPAGSASFVATPAASILSTSPRASLADHARKAGSSVTAQPSTRTGALILAARSVPGAAAANLHPSVSPEGTGRRAASEGTPATSSPVTVAPNSRGPSRWSGAAWLLWRPDVGSGLASAPLLGGSQAGLRIDYRLARGAAGQLSAYGRLSRAFVGASSEEAALGLAWRPGRLPLSLLAERRQRIGPGGRNGFAFIAAGGFGPRDVARRVEAEGYAQAGVVGLPGADGFADGKASLGYRLTPGGASARLTVGASLSGSAQPGAERLDLGPEVRLRFPFGGIGLRLSAEWRARIAGDARPASGPTITLVSDF